MQPGQSVLHNFWACIDDIYRCMLVLVREAAGRVGGAMCVETRWSILENIFPMDAIPCRIPSAFTQPQLHQLL